MGKNKKNKKKAGDQASRTYWKGWTNYKCSSTTCGAAWGSAHGWNGEDPVSCEFCNKQAKIVKVLDENMEIAVYNCTGPNCDNQWKSIPDQKPQECDICGTMVLPGGTQVLFGRHFWFACKFKKCPVEVKAEWEDFSLESQPTQRCNKCGSRGDILSFQKLIPKAIMDRWKEKDKDDDGRVPYQGGPGKHVIDLCDMCCRIRQHGLGRSCHRFRKAVAKVEDVPGGGVIETIVSVR